MRWTKPGMEHVAPCAAGVCAAARAAAARGDPCASFCYDSQLDHRAKRMGITTAMVRGNTRFHAAVREVVVGTGAAADVKAWHSDRAGSQYVIFTAYLARKNRKRPCA